MALELKQNLKLSQQLVMTPQLQQAIRLLQLSRQELIDTVTAELAENPLLDVDETPEMALDQAAADTQAVEPDLPDPDQIPDELPMLTQNGADGEAPMMTDGIATDFGPVSGQDERRETERTDTEQKA